MRTLVMNNVLITIKDDMVVYQNKKGEVVDVVTSKQLANILAEQGVKTEDIHSKKKTK
jgi:hypothetical protein